MRDLGEQIRAVTGRVLPLQCPWEWSWQGAACSSRWQTWSPASSHPGLRWRLSQRWSAWPATPNWLRSSSPQTIFYLSFLILWPEAGCPVLDDLTESNNRGDRILGSDSKLLLGGGGSGNQRLRVLHQRLGGLQDVLSVIWGQVCVSIYGQEGVSAEKQDGGFLIECVAFFTFDSGSFYVFRLTLTSWHRR